LRPFAVHPCNIGRYFLLLTAVFLALPSGAGFCKVGLLGTAAPGFTAKSVAGEDLSRDTLLSEGNVVVITFWGMRCAACIEEMGALNGLAPRLAGKKVRILEFNTDGLNAKELAEAMKENGVVSRFTVVPDPDFKVMEAYKLEAAPLTYIIGKDGVIAYEHIGFKPGDETELERLIDKAIAQ